MGVFTECLQNWSIRNVGKATGHVCSTQATGSHYNPTGPISVTLLNLFSERTAPKRPASLYLGLLGAHEETLI